MVDKAGPIDIRTLVEHEDARGKRASLLTPQLMLELHSTHIIPHAELREIVAAIDAKRKTRRSGRWLKLAILAVCVIALVFTVYEMSTGGVGIPSVVEMILGIVAATFVFCLAYIDWRNAGSTKHVVGVLLAYRRCPHCGYDLQGLPPSTKDGATVCPECSCAWILDTDAPCRPDIT